MTPSCTATGGHHFESIYRYYDEHRVLIYVGITARGNRRNLEHGDGADWWPFVAHQKVDHVETRAKALAQERELIRRYRPPFNKPHNPDWESMRAAYLAFREGSASDDWSPTKAWQAVGRQLKVRPYLAADEGQNLWTLVTTAEAAPIIPYLGRTNGKIRVYANGERVGRIHDVRPTGLVAAILVQGKKRIGDYAVGTAQLTFDTKAKKIRIGAISFYETDRLVVA